MATMTTTDAQAGTNVAEIAAGLFRISTPVPVDGIPGGFTFNQFLLVDEEPLLFHTGPRRLFSVTRTSTGSTGNVEVGWATSVAKTIDLISTPTHE